MLNSAESEDLSHVILLHEDMCLYVSAALVELGDAPIGTLYWLLPQVRLEEKPTHAFGWEAILKTVIWRGRITLKIFFLIINQTQN